MLLRCCSTALLFAIAIPLLPADAHAGFKSGASFHPVPPNIHPIRHPAGRPASIGNRSHFTAEMHERDVHRFHKFSRHDHNRLSGWGLPLDTGALGYYGSYYDPAGYDPADEPGDADPAISGYGPPPGWPRARAFYRTGCRSEEVSVPGSHGPTHVTVTRCSVPIPEPQPLK
jgi:hypothetical protein